MVVQEEEDAPMEVPLSSQTKKYVVVKNHVRELLPENASLVPATGSNNTAEKTNTVKKKSLKRKKDLQIVLPTASEPTNISESDLEELRTVYRKCKAVLKKLESKYGHLLDIEDNISIENSKDTLSEEPVCEYCSCSKNKKIVFDENGQQIHKDSQIENHICIKRIKKSHIGPQQYEPSVRVEYDNINTNLPDNLQELENILKDVNINKSYRQMVIDKIYLTRQEYLNEIRFEKHDIIKQLKENADELLDFKGTNLSLLAGYPSKPAK